MQIVVFMLWTSNLEVGEGGLQTGKFVFCARKIFFPTQFAHLENGPRVFSPCDLFYFYLILFILVIIVSSVELAFISFSYSAGQL